MAYDHPCFACRHRRAQHRADTPDAYPPREGLGPNYCQVKGCGCTDFTFPPWSEYPTRAAWKAAVEAGGQA